MDWKSEWKKLVLLAAVFLAAYWLPMGWPRFELAVLESLYLVKWYAQEHVVMCLLPALFIAGAIAVFVSQASVMRYLGARAHKALAYAVASVSGSVLAVCSCTVLPLFAGIYRMGAGLGPATAFLYAGPAINVLAIILTARVLGLELGIARAVGAIGFSVVIGLAMQWIYRKEETERVEAQLAMPDEAGGRPLWQTVLWFVPMVAMLVFVNCCRVEPAESRMAALVTWRWLGSGVVAVMFGVMLVWWVKVAWWKVAGVGVVVAGLVLAFPGVPTIAVAAGGVGLAVITATTKGEGQEWFSSTWEYTKQIVPLLLAGVVVAGLLFGRVGSEGLIPSRYVEMLVGSKPDVFLSATGLGGSAAEGFVRATWSVWTNLFASVVGALMYFATLTEVPILQGLMGSGMDRGPALALLLAGPALSLPNMLVIRSVMGTKKTLTYVALVVVMATISGMLFGLLPAHWAPESWRGF